MSLGTRTHHALLPGIVNEERWLNGHGGRSPRPLPARTLVAVHSPRPTGRAGKSPRAHSATIRVSPNERCTLRACLRHMRIINNSFSRSFVLATRPNGSQSINKRGVQRKIRCRIFFLNDSAAGALRVALTETSGTMRLAFSVTLVTKIGLASSTFPGILRYAYNLIASKLKHPQH